MQFEEVKEFLESLKSFERMSNYKYDSEEFDLMKLKRVFEVLKFDLSKVVVVEVVGSKGKTTVSGLMAFYLQQKNYKVGVFSSPALIDVCDLVVINGEKIGVEDFSRLAGELRLIIDRNSLKLTYFEFLLTLALAFFLEAGVDYIILEAGMGGKLDAINSLDADLTMLTRVEKEHTTYLGNTYQEILGHKLGVKREGKPMIVGIQLDEVLSLIKSRKDFDEFVFVQDDQVLLKRISVLNQGCERDRAFLENLALVAAGARNIFGQINEDILLKGLEKYYVPGRYDQKIINGKQFVFDVAHTVFSAKNLVDALKRDFPGKKFYFLVALMKDKAIVEILSILKPLAKEIVFTHVNGERGSLAHDYGSGVFFENVSEALEFFQSIKPGHDESVDDQVFVVTGSNYLVGSVFKLIST